MLAVDLSEWLANGVAFLKVLIGFSVIIFVHELGHFLVAKWSGVRIERFSIGFGPRLFGWRSGEGLTFGRGRNLKPAEVRERGWGETDYCFRAFPLGGYVKMLGQDDIQVDEETGKVTMTDDPRAFTNRPVGQRMLIVSAGVVFNVVFAALLYMWVYLLGIQMPAPVIGLVELNSPAEQAGLMTNDRILSINGRRTETLIDLRAAEVFSKELRLKIERNGEVLPDEIVVHPANDPARRMIGIGAHNGMSPTLRMDVLPVDGQPAPRAGDTIVAVEGRPFQGALDLISAFQTSEGRLLELTVQRPRRDQPGVHDELKVYMRGVLRIAPVDLAREEDDTHVLDRSHLLGLLPRQAITAVAPGGPAAEAGFEAGDTIAMWDTIAHPLYSEIVESIQARAGVPTKVVVERAGADGPVELEVTPRRQFQLFGQGPVRVGLVFGRIEEGRAVVAQTVPGTPAAELGLPRGARLIEIGGEPVESWFDVLRALKDAAGRRVGVSYRFAEQTVTAEMTVPSSIVNEVGLPADAEVLSVDGVRTAGGEDEPGMALPSVYGLRELLRERSGETVTIEYGRMAAPQARQTAQFTVREDNIDPWQMRMRIIFSVALFDEERVTVHAHGNPLLAMWMGVRYTTLQALNLYQAMSQMAQRNVPADSVAGPIGIIGVGVSEARESFVSLLSFLAFLSINLAVINFLPIPVVDGGVMIFLIIEKIKGSPISLRVQVISTLVGLSLIALVFIVVTFQDIVRLVGA